MSEIIPLPYLPENIMEEIFRKLPYDAMARSKLVCKTWNSIISSPKFLGDDRLIFSYYNQRRKLNLYTSIYSNLADDTLSLSPISPIDEPIRWGYKNKPRLLGTYNGLVAISCENRLILWNPLTKKHLFVNAAIDEYQSKSSFPSRFLLGLCYDGDKDEYSVVIAEDYQSPPASPSNFDGVVEYGRTIVCLYNFKDGSARDISYGQGPDGEYFSAGLDCGLLDGRLFDGGVGKVVRGIPHWVAKCYDYEDGFVMKTDILYFDLNEEKFKLMDKPGGGDEKIVIGLAMLDGENQLGCVLHDAVGECFDVWVMKEYGKAESWSNMFTLSYLSIGDTFGTNIDYMDVMGVLPSRELLICLNDTEFWAYSVERGDSRKIKLPDKEFCSVVAYQPKLTSPPKSNTKSVISETSDNVTEYLTDEYEEDTY